MVKTAWLRLSERDVHLLQSSTGGSFQLCEHRQGAQAGPPLKVAEGDLHPADRKLRSPGELKQRQLGLAAWAGAHQGIDEGEAEGEEVGLGRASGAAGKIGAYGLGVKTVWSWIRVAAPDPRLNPHLAPLAAGHLEGAHGASAAQKAGEIGAGNELIGVRDGQSATLQHGSHLGQRRLCREEAWVLGEQVQPAAVGMGTVAVVGARELQHKNCPIVRDPPHCFGRTHCSA